MNQIYTAEQIKAVAESEVERVPGNAAERCARETVQWGRRTQKLMSVAAAILLVNGAYLLLNGFIVDASEIPYGFAAAVCGLLFLSLIAAGKVIEAQGHALSLMLRRESKEETPKEN